MRFFNNYYFRWFVAAFCLGAATVPIASTIYDLKNPKVEWPHFTLTGNLAWALMALNLGIIAGALGLVVGSLKKSLNKAA